MAGVSFERVAHCYDETRGGERRGRAVAEGVLPYLSPGGVVEIGIGTGVVAMGLRAHGRTVTGVDLSPAMLARAVDRLGPSVAVADAARLPFPRQASANALLVWVLQLVPDIAETLAEAARVVRPGGRVVVVPSRSIRDDEAWHIVHRMYESLPRRPGMYAADVEAAGARCGLLRHVATELALHQPFELTPSSEARLIAERAYSSLFDVDDAAFERHCRPAMAALLALPDPDRPRPVEAHQHVVVFNRR